MKKIRPARISNSHGPRSAVHSAVAGPVLVTVRRSTKQALLWAFIWQGRFQTLHGHATLRLPQNSSHSSAAVSALCLPHVPLVLNGHYFAVSALLGLLGR